MNVKAKINLIRGILYLQEVIYYQSLSRAAQENNVKVSNLSIIINNLEKELGASLLKRSAEGSVPTGQGRKFSQYALEIQEIFNKITGCIGKDALHHDILNVYVAPHLELSSYREFENQHKNIVLHFVEEEQLADISVNNRLPQDKKISFAEFYIGGAIKQKIWICCNEQNPAALAFFDFIIGKLQFLYNQSEL